MSPARAALTEPGATGLHAVLLAERTMARPISEARALVLGAGSVGLLTALILQDKGVIRVDLAETNALRRKTVAAHTDCHVFNPLQSPPDTSSYDLVFDAVGNSITRQSSIASVRSGGVIVHIGLMDNKGGMDVRSITLREISFIGSYTYTPVDLQQTLRKLYDGSLGSLEWVEQRPLAQGARAFDELNNGLCAAPKIVLNI
jgi:alcohol dehydrogenase